jgi:hypothetical protein
MLDEVEIHEPWRKAGYPIPLYHKNCPSQRVWWKVGSKRTMRYRQEEAPCRLECPDCGAICTQAVTMILMLRVNRL